MCAWGSTFNIDWWPKSSNSAVDELDTSAVTDAPDVVIATAVAPAGLRLQEAASRHMPVPPSHEAVDEPARVIAE